MNDIELNDTQKQSLTVIWKIISDAERALTQIIGSRVDLTIEVQKSEVNYEELKELFLQQIVCHQYDVAWADVVKSTRGKENIAAARRAYCYLAYRVLGHSYPRIGRDIHRHYSSAIHSVRVAQDFIDVNDDQAKPILNLKSKLYENLNKA